MSTFITTQDCPEYYFEERCYIRELLNSEQAPGLSIAQARVLPGVTTVLHALKGTEIYYILSGEGVAEVGEERKEVTAGMLVHISPEKAQRIYNSGKEDLVFLAICSPRFLPEDYQSLGA
ncbi:MAG: cupin domain-containing protein [Lewinella sp.]|jgi:mannose-6-phosphate isomerase-like protein (cupin superfamily)|uniref:cupin domain-containing protein n=1 Tax=Lewinella sp. TaxID=2004506 RepID=UPI003D6B8FDC